MKSKTSNHDDKIMNCSTFDELLDVEYGKTGTPEREQFDTDATAFCLAETLKEELLKTGLTQQQLAERIGTKKTYIDMSFTLADKIDMMLILTRGQMSYTRNDGVKVIPLATIKP